MLIQNKYFATTKGFAVKFRIRFVVDNLLNKPKHNKTVKEVDHLAEIQQLEATIRDLETNLTEQNNKVLELQRDNSRKEQKIRRLEQNIEIDQQKAEKEFEEAAKQQSTQDAITEKQELQKQIDKLKDENQILLNVLINGEEEISSTSKSSQPSEVKTGSWLSQIPNPNYYLKKHGTKIFTLVTVAIGNYYSGYQHGKFNNNQALTIQNSQINNLTSQLDQC